MTDQPAHHDTTAERQALAAYDVSAQHQHTKLVVFGDSLTHFGPEGALPPHDLRLWPAALAHDMGLELALFAEAGWTTRQGWWAITRNPTIWEAIAESSAVVLGLCSMDSMPSPLPTALREGLRYIRPPRLRRAVRKGYLALQPQLSPYLPWQALPPHLTVEYLERMRIAITVVRPDVPLVAVTPCGHWGKSYGYAQPGRDKTGAAVRQWAQKKEIPVVDLYAETRSYVENHIGNPDGLHWGFDAHRDVADAFLRIFHTRTNWG